MDLTEASHIVRLLKLAATRRYSKPTSIYAQRHSINKKLRRLQQLGVEAPQPGSDREYEIESVVESWLTGESNRRTRQACQREMG